MTGEDLSPPLSPAAHGRAAGGGAGRDSGCAKGVASASSYGRTCSRAGRGEGARRHSPLTFPGAGFLGIEDVKGGIILCNTGGGGGGGCPVHSRISTACVTSTF